LTAANSTSFDVSRLETGYFRDPGAISVYGSSRPECIKLWRAYSAATTEHIQLDDKLRLAALKHDLEQIVPLNIQVEAAERARTGARDTIRAHKARITMRKSYGFRAYRVLELALYHSLCKLPEPISTHDFF
jgi:hypothetical protein